jgi:hypothetical protein
MLRFHSPLIEPDGRVSRIRLSDGLHRSAPRTRPTAVPSPTRTALSATAEPYVGLLDRTVNPLALGRFHSAPEVRPLPSAGVTRFPRYCEPVRHPSAARPAPHGGPVERRCLSPLGSPVLRPVSVCSHAVAITPVGPQSGIGSLPLTPATAAFPVSLPGRLPHQDLSRPAQRSRMLRPDYSRGRLAALSIEGFGDLVTSIAAPIATGWSESCRVGIAPTQDKRLSRRTTK